MFTTYRGASQKLCSILIMEVCVKSYETVLATVG